MPSRRRKGHVGNNSVTIILIVCSILCFDKLDKIRSEEVTFGQDINKDNPINHIDG